MRLVFAGTPEFARIALEAMAEAGFAPALVLTQPDRPAGRGLKLQSSPVKRMAMDAGWPVAQPRSLRLEGKYPQDAADARAALEALRPDVMVVAAYGLILPAWVLALPRLGCLNIHASLLPRWRGAAPIHRAVEAGDAETGITIMQMDAGLDTGAMLLRESISVGDASTAHLHDRLAALGGRMIVEALRRAEAGSLAPVPQPAEGVTYARKVEKHEAVVDWHQSADVVARRIRAFDPFPGAASILAGESVKFWRAHVVQTSEANRDAHAALGPATRPVTDDGSAPAPGTVLSADAEGIVVAAGDGAVAITELQRPSGRRLGAAEFLRGFAVEPGQVFG